jgi:hypothetical protein
MNRINHHIAANRRPHAKINASSVVVHLLVNGRMACGFDLRPPALWERGQVWVSVDKSHLLSCAACMTEARKVAKGSVNVYPSGTIPPGP